MLLFSPFINNDGLLVKQENNGFRHYYHHDWCYQLGFQALGSIQASRQETFRSEANIIQAILNIVCYTLLQTCVKCDCAGAALDEDAWLPESSQQRNGNLYLVAL
jgi:hypothetical protein